MECNMTRCYMLISTICLMMVNSLIGAEFNEQPLVSNRSTKFEKMSPLRSHFSSRSKGKKRVSRPPTFAIPNRNCSAFQPVQELEEIDIEVKQFTSLGLENIDTAVVDTQGYEIEVLKGFNEKIYDLNIAIVEFANYEGYINQPTYKKLNKFMKKKGFVPIDQVKRINKPIPTKKGGSFGDVLFLNSKLLNKKNIYFYRLKNYIINLIIFDLFVFTKKILKRYIKTILKK